MRLRFPHPLALLVGCILLATLLTHVVPAGHYERRHDAATDREVVVAGTYQPVAATPVGPFAALVALPRGMADAASVIFLVFLVGGAWTVVERTGVLSSAVGWLVRLLADRERLVIPITCVVFAAGGVLIQMQEELIAFAPVLVLLTSRLRFDRVTAVAMSLGAAVVGAAFSPIDPFLVGIAQKVADVPLLSGLWFRIAWLIPALGLWIWGTMRHARRHPAEAPPADATTPAVAGAGGWRQAAILTLVLGAFGLFVYGVLVLGWDFDQMSALFFAMGVAAGLLGGLRIGGTAEAFVEGFKSMAYAALLIGFARGIYVVMQDGQIVDTLVQGLFTPIENLPVSLSALGMMAAHSVIHLPVPSTSGQAVLTMPILAPLSDLLGMSRQIAVLAYQYGAGLCDLLTPTNGALMAMIAACGVGYDRWLRFAIPLVAGLALLAGSALLVAVAIGLT